MIPSITILTEEITEPKYANRTYKIHFHDEILSTNDSQLNVPYSLNTKNTGNTYMAISTDSGILGVGVIGTMTLGTEGSSNAPMDRINGYADDIESVIQAIYLILSSERYKHIIYSWDYGIELLDLYGKPMNYVISELPNRIREALTQDNRISDVTDFEFDSKGNKLRTTFTVISDIGDISTAIEVVI